VHEPIRSRDQIWFVTVDARPDMTECNAYSHCVPRVAGGRLSRRWQVLLEIPAIDGRWWWGVRLSRRKRRSTVWPPDRVPAGRAAHQQHISRRKSGGFRQKTMTWP